MKALFPITALLFLSSALHAEEDSTLRELQELYPSPDFKGGPRVVPLAPEHEAIFDIYLPYKPESENSQTENSGWRALTADDFTQVNSADDTWTWYGNVLLVCSGKPVSVLRTKKQFTNFELIVEWNHQKPAGNSGVFVWTTPDSIEKLAKAGKPGLPDGIEVQVLDPDFTNKMKAADKKTDWFTCHGDVFPVRTQMTPIGKTSPDGSRSFPRQDRCRPHGQWNHYYIRAINGEVRLWVNGEEVSGGTACDPDEGYLCLESEGSPILFRRLRIRELP